MDVGTIIAIVGSTFAIVFSMMGSFLWVRTEANNDRRDISNIQREDRKELLQISKNLELIMKAIQQESAEFHIRLCEIEEKNRK